MSRVVPPGHWAREVALHFNTNQNSIFIPIPFAFDHVVEVWLNGYHVTAPNGGAVYPSLWKLDLGDWLREQEVSNSIGKGISVSIFNAVGTHHYYDRPRIFSVMGRQKLSQLSGRLTAISFIGGSEVESLPLFDDAVFYLTFIMKDPLWNPPEKEVAEDRLIPRYWNHQYSTRATF